MNIDYSNGYETLSKRELLQRYRDDLDERNEEVRIDSMTWLPSRVLEEVDPIAFECGFSDWMDAEGWEETDEDDEDKYSEEGDETPSPLLSSELDHYG